jgi:hypothetical protein
MVLNTFIILQLTLIIRCSYFLDVVYINKMGNNYSEIKETRHEQTKEVLTEREIKLHEKLKICPFINCKSSNQLVVYLPFNEKCNIDKVECRIIIKTYDLTGLTDQETYNVLEEALDFVETKLIKRIKELFIFDENY